MVCDPARSTTGYSPATGRSCGAGPSACSEQDTCDLQGICQANHQPAETACGSSQSSVCDQSDTCDGNGTCVTRAAPNGTPCDDGLFCSVDDQCQGGSCVSTADRNCGAAQACNETVDQCQCQGCVVNSRCFAPGAVNTVNPCQICDPVRSTTAFSPNTNAVCGSGPAECSAQDTCNNQGQCLPNHLPAGTACGSAPGGQCQADGLCAADQLAGRDPILLATVEEEGQGIVVNGAQVGDQAGRSLASGGDVNGDGIEDLVVGTNGAERNGAVRGLAYVVFGTRQRLSISLASVENGQGGFVITPADDDSYLGRSVAMAGDVNGDGLDDVIVGAIEAGGQSVGAAYVIFGKASTDAVSVAAIASGQGGGFAINGTAVGAFVAAAGDVNGDDLADIVVSVGGTRAGARVVFGTASTSAVDSEELQSGGFPVLSGAEIISAVAGVGDVNGDGLDDIGLGSADAEVLGNASAGRAFVVFGKTVRTAVQLSTIQDGQPGGFVMNGARPEDRAGASIARAGDLNQDGLSDVVVGANRAESNGSAAVGRAYAVFGKGNSTPIQLAAIEAGTEGGFALNGVSTEDDTGAAVAGGSDINGDGIDDLLIGATNALSFTGMTYAVFGKSSGSPVALVDLRSGGRGGFAIQGANQFDSAGNAVGSGDFDGDGITDLIIGASRTAPGGAAPEGAVHVIFGEFAR
jgi:hypothetical protein